MTGEYLLSETMAAAPAPRSRAGWACEAPPHEERTYLREWRFRDNEIKALAASCANHSGFLNAYAFLRRKLTKSQVAILIYHRVAPKNDNWPLEPLDPQSFRKQIEYFCQSYEILPLDRLVQYIQEGQSLPEKAIVITFDDGYKDNFHYAYPILKKYHVPATIFLTTGHIDTDKLFWWDKISYIIQHSCVENIILDEVGSHSLRSKIDKLRARSIVIERMKKLPQERKEQLIDKLISISGVDVPSGLGEGLILSWKEIRKMNNNGINFGAHTVNHPCLVNLPLEQAKWEIIQSKNDIEEKLGKKVNAFSYPNGDSSLELVEFIKESGFTCAVSVLPNRLLSPKDNLYKLGRIGGIEEFNKFKVMFSGLGGDLQSI
jgi:peptidoglycan/xylan/chitin deacetylase (PgdA/CDA1 family)